MTVDEPGQQGGLAKVNDLRATRSPYLRGRANLLDLVPVDQNCSRRKHIPRARIQKSPGFDQSEGSGRLGAELRHRTEGHDQ